MTIDKQKGKYVATCDGCDDVIVGNGDLSPAAFDELVNDLRAEGWKFEKKIRGGTYEHYCPKKSCNN